MSISRFSLMSFLVVVGGIAVGSSASFAASASAGCFVGAARLSDDAISSFLSAPDSLLTTNPNGGVALAANVRELAGSSADTLPKLQALISSANASQKSAIGAGLARAARACQRSAPDYAQQIQAFVAGIQSPELVAAFVGALSEVQTAAIGGGAVGGGAAGGAGAGGIGNTGAGAGTTGGGTDTSSTVGGSGQLFSFSSGRSVGSVGGDSTSTTIISVSPTT